MSAKQFIRPRQTRVEPKGDLLRALEVIEKLTVAARSQHGARSDALHQLLHIASEATSGLNDTILVDRADPEIRAFIEETISLQHYWPIPFNETEDLRKYTALRIGYLAIPSRNPRKRTGNTVFSDFALALVLKLRVLRAECQIGLENTPPAVKSALRQRIKNHQEQWQTSCPVDALDDPLRAIAAWNPPQSVSFEKLPEFSKATAQDWRSAALLVLAGALPRPNEVVDLAKQINDSDVDSEGQIRARIVQRIGRAVAALAP